MSAPAARPAGAERPRPAAAPLPGLSRVSRRFALFLSGPGLPLQPLILPCSSSLRPLGVTAIPVCFHVL